MFQVSVLSGEDAKKLLKMDEVSEAVENVYVKKSMGETTVYPLVFTEFEPGVADMDIKSGDIKGDIFGLKMVSWFAENTKQNIPALIGTIIVCDAKTGVPLGIVDGSHITGMRTGAAAAIGAKYLARKNSDTVLVIGAGHISTYIIASVVLTLPNVKKIMLSDPLAVNTEESRINEIKANIVKDYGCSVEGIEFLPAGDLQSACGNADIIITATPSKQAIIKKEWVKEGTHFSCIGADMPGKNEIENEILKDAIIVTDDTDQCINVGEIETAVKAGIISKANVVGEIGDIITGSKSGRTSDSDITVFDATGMALLDLATAKIALEKAKTDNIGTQAEI